MNKRVQVTQQEFFKICSELQNQREVVMKDRSAVRVDRASRAAQQGRACAG